MKLKLMCRKIRCLTYLGVWVKISTQRLSLSPKTSVPSFLPGLFSPQYQISFYPRFWEFPLWCNRVSGVSAAQDAGSIPRPAQRVKGQCCHSCGSGRRGSWDSILGLRTFLCHGFGQKWGGERMCRVRIPIAIVFIVLDLFL